MLHLICAVKVHNLGKELVPLLMCVWGRKMKKKNLGKQLKKPCEALINIIFYMKDILQHIHKHSLSEQMKLTLEKCVNWILLLLLFENHSFLHHRLRFISVYSQVPSCKRNNVVHSRFYRLDDLKWKTRNDRRTGSGGN